MEDVNECIYCQGEEESTFRNFSLSITGANTQFAMRANYFEINTVYTLRNKKEIHTVPKGATTDAGANAYEIKLPVSPIFMSAKPNHLEDMYQGLNSVLMGIRRQ